MILLRAPQVRAVASVPGSAFALGRAPLAAPRCIPVRTAADLADKHRHTTRFRPPPPPDSRPCPSAFQMRPIYRCGTLALKAGMTTIWDHWGVSHAVTMLRIKDLFVVSARAPEPGKELNVRVATEPVDMSTFTKAQYQLLNAPRRSRPVSRDHEEVAMQLRGTKSLCDAAGVPTLREITTFHVSSRAIVPVGSQIFASHYDVGKYIDLASTTINKGFQGVVKRWGFKGQPASHGVSKKHRSPGSIGSSRSKGRVFPGKKMPGVMGNKYRFVRKCRIMMIDHDEDMLFVKGAVPGHAGCYVRVQDTTVRSRELAGPVPTCPHGRKAGVERLLPSTESGSDGVPEQDPFLTGLEDTSSSSNSGGAKKGLHPQQNKKAGGGTAAQSKRR